MNYKRALLLTTILSLSVSSETINKSPSDPRSYETFFLNNGIEVITISDANLAVSAATLSVGVGAYQDPENAQGIAHFLEHMIFMGSEKYKEPNEYMKFISENGGDTNAFTAAEQTTYLFSINNNKFEEALDRLASSIKEPLLNGDMVEKEINAVNSEWLLRRQDEGFVRQRSLAMTGNIDHPRVKLGVGNKETLSEQRDTLLKSLREFYDRYYSANIMKLVLIGNQPPKQLKKLAKKYFEGIENRNASRDSTSVAAYLPEHLGLNIYIKSKVQSPEMGIEFPIRNNINDWSYKANAYIEKILNSQEPNSLMSILIEEGYIQSGSASFFPNVWGSDGSAFIDFLLTEKGQANKNKILSMTFQYLDLMREQGINQEHFEELRSINKIGFEDLNTQPPLETAVGLSWNIFDIESKHLIDYRFRTDEFKPDLILSSLSQLVPTNARVYHISPTEITNQDLRYADGGFRFEELDLEIFNYNLSEDYALSIPIPEVIDEEASTENKSIKGFEKPQLVYRENGVQAYLSHTQNFSGREGTLHIGLISPQPISNVDNLVSSFLLHAMFVKKNRGFLQRAAKRGTFISPIPNQQGNITFRFFGRSGKQVGYAEEIIKRYVEFEFTDGMLKDAIKLYKDNYASLAQEGISTQLDFYTSLTTKQPPSLYSVKQILGSLDNSNIQAVRKFHAEILGSSFLDIYGHGLFDPEDITQLALVTRGIIGTSNQKEPWHLSPDFNVKVGTSRMRKVNIPKDGVGINDIYIYPEKSLKVLSKFKLINKLLSPSFFNNLRTEQQVGYAVYSYDSEIHDFPALSMTIVSDNTNLQNLKEKIMDFQYGFAIALEKVDSSTINGVKKALLDELNQKPENIYVEASSFINEWEEGNYEFNRDDKIKAHIQEITKKDLIELNNSITFDGNFMNITVQLRGDDFQKDEFFSWAAINR